jgi:hypothetical protein
VVGIRRTRAEKAASKSAENSDLYGHRGLSGPHCSGYSVASLSNRHNMRGGGFGRRQLASAGLAPWLAPAPNRNTKSINSVRHPSAHQV